MKIDEELARTEYMRKLNWGKLLNVGKRQFDEWATRKLAESGYNDFKITYMPVMMNIRPEGINNNELAIFARVTKQAMSKVAKELADLGYIKPKPSTEDKRITIFTLTDRGKKLVLQCRLAVHELMEEYRSEFGRKNVDQMLQMMGEIIAYNDKKKNRKELI
jgi:DNA-binding MarR family transcriptional regulator